MTSARELFAVVQPTDAMSEADRGDIQTLFESRGYETEINFPGGEILVYRTDTIDE